MKTIYSLFWGLIFLTGVAQAQSNQMPAPKVHDVFLEFLTEKIQLSLNEKQQMRPLIIRYFGAIRKINKTVNDPLIKEQERINLKLRYRKTFTPIIGQSRATRFFAEEQLFRKKIREELKKRNVKKN